MKKIIYILLFPFLCAGCSKSFIEIDPLGTLTGDKVFSDISGYSTALNGAYNLFAKYHLGNYGLYGDLRSDNVLVNLSIQNSFINEYNYQSDPSLLLSPVFYIWSNIFETLNNTNNIIEAREELLKSQSHYTDSINAIYGQALVLRAMCHFDLANVYAQTYTYTVDGSHLGVPLLLQTPYPGTLVGRENMKKTYEQIIVDLKEGARILKNVKRSKMFASADAANALLSRVYLYMHDWDNVIATASPLVNNQEYGLVSAANYMGMFIKASQRTDFSTIDSEVIWQLNLTSNDASYLTKIYSSDVDYSVYPSSSLLTLYENDDVRKSQFLEDLRRPGQFFSNKYGRTPETLEQNWPVNFKMIRSAELYLNLAEAYYQDEQYGLAADNLAVIKRRAYDDPNLMITYTSPADLLAQIKLERRKELAFESQRIYDIMRYHENLSRGTDCNSTTCQLTYPNDRFVLPIPLYELNTNEKMQPNPGVNN